MAATLAVLLAYLAILAALAIWSRGETHSLSGFFLGAKKLPYWVVAFSTNATGESGWLSMIAAWLELASQAGAGLALALPRG